MSKSKTGAATKAFRAAIGNDVANRAYSRAINALHAYAQASDCPAGGNVIEWFESRLDEATAAWRKAFEAA